MITPAQIRAARSMLGWSAAQLSKSAEITVNGINKIERGRVNAQRDTLERLQAVFEEHGVEFLPGFGLREKNRKATLIRGLSANNDLAIDVYETLKDIGGELLIIADEDISSKNLDPKILSEQVLKRKEHNIKHRLLTPASKKSVIKNLKNCYRHIADAYIPQCPIFIYGNKFAILIPEYAPKVLIIENARLADAARGFFNFMWEHATLDVPSTSHIHKDIQTAAPFSSTIDQISADQIRAARAFLDWSTADLAEQTGITANTINKIERKQVTPHKETITAIQAAFEGAGIEFLPSDGLKRKDSFVIVWDDANACNKLFSDIYEQMRDKGGLVLVSGITETNCASCVGEDQLRRHIQRLESCNVLERVIVKHGDTRFIGPLETYHWMEEKYFSPDTICIYNTRIALVTWTPQRVIIFDDIRMANSLRCLFSFLWDFTSPIPPHLS